MDNWRVAATPSQVSDVVQRIQGAGDREMKFTVRRDGTIIEVRGRDGGGEGGWMGSPFAWMKAVAVFFVVVIFPVLII